MDTDLVNMFVTKQRDVINDLMSKNILLEARLAIAEKYVQQMEALRQQLSAYEQEIQQLKNDMQNMTAQYENSQRLLQEEQFVTATEDRAVTNDEFFVVSSGLT